MKIEDEHKLKEMLDNILESFLLNDMIVEYKVEINNPKSIDIIVKKSTTSGLLLVPIRTGYT